MIEGIFLSLYLILGWCVAQIFVFNFFKIKNKFPVLSILYLPTLFLYIFFSMGNVSYSTFPVGFINGLCLHLIFYATYLACFYYVDRPVTFRILIEFLRHKEESLRVEDIEKHYSLEFMVERRLKLLLKDGLICEKNGRFFIDKKGEKMGKMIAFGRRVICSSFLRKCEP